MNTIHITVPLDGIAGGSYKMFTYPGGEMQVRLTEDTLHRLREADVITVWAYLRGPGHIMELALLTDALQNANKYATYNLVLPYLPYARADRRFVDGDCYGLKVFGQTINRFAYDNVVTVDAHSAAAKRQVNNLIDIHPGEFVAKALAQLGDALIVFPDEGASTRYAGMFSKTVRCKKVRDSGSGLITTIEVPPIEPLSNRALVVDDICDGGATFTAIGKNIKANYPGLSLNLYVTHGIFSQGLDKLKKYYNNIFTCDTIDYGYSRDGVKVISTHSAITKELNEYVCPRR